jgi:uncharacterized protein (DUF983 family)
MPAALSKISSILKLKCPRCRQGSQFPTKNPYVLNFDQMYTHCPHCRLKYERETGFFYGAMYAAYGLTVTFSIILYIAVYLFVDIPLWVYLLINALLLLALVPVTFRLARSLWLHLFVKYEPSVNEH